MGLVRCVDCGNDVSDTAPACPKCGRLMRAPQISIEVKRGIGCGGAILVLLLMIAMIALIVATVGKASL